MENNMTASPPITKEGHQRILKRLDHMITFERPKAAQAIGIAREHGDLSENAEYDAAKDAQGLLEARIGALQGQLASVQIIDPTSIKSDRIAFGATVKVLDLNKDEEVEYQIVGEPEADLKAGKISFKTPIARSLIGKSVGDLIDVNVPGGVRSLEILDLQYK
jgi:transcription elongation factor GreA